MIPTWEPRHDPSIIASHVNRLIEDALGRQRTTDPSYDESAFTPPVDIIEEESCLRIRAEIPGVSKDDIEIHVENGVLEVTGTKPADAKVAKEHYRRKERIYGRFARNFTLPRSLDSSKIEATFRDGVLELKLPKVESATPRKIEVK